MSNLGTKSSFVGRGSAAGIQKRSFIAFAVIAILIVLFWAGVGYAIYNVATDPGQIGEAAGEVVKGYNETVK